MVGINKLTAIVAAAWAMSQAVAADDARGLLERMERSLATRNYQGTFVHEHDGQSETLKIVHRVVGNEVAERIASMDGSGREIVRRNGELRAYFPDRRLVLVESGPKEGLLLNDLRRLDNAASQMYRLHEEAATRISGRAARVIAVEPQDDMRYGYRVWIDESSAMPLKTQLRTLAGRVVEQLVFTELTLPAHIAETMLQARVMARDYRWLRHDTAALASQPAIDSAAGTTWDAVRLPPGFRLTANSMQILAGASAAVTHLVFSDGVASVSVFVEPQRAADLDSPSLPAAATLTNLGPSSALSVEVNGHWVTAIGEVPPATVRAIASSMRAGFAPAVNPGLMSRRR